MDRQAWVRMVGCLALVVGMPGGCGDDESGSDSHVARAYDQLTRTLSDCAQQLLECGDVMTDREGCRDSYRACQKRASEGADSQLRAAIDACIDAAGECRNGAQDAGDALTCSQTLRRCIGEPAEAKARSELPRFDNVDPDAPTYQCFGQLRNCVESGESSKSCSAQVRDCVIVAIGRLDPSLTRATGSGGADGGERARDAGPATAAGRGGQGDGREPRDAGREPRDAGREPRDAGREPRDAGREPESRPECAAGYEACLAAGGKATTCETARRVCDDA